MQSTPGVTDEEIQSYMDFNVLLTKNRLASVQRKQRTIIKSIVLGLSLAVFITGIWFFNMPTRMDDTVSVEPLKKIISPVLPEDTNGRADTVMNKSASATADGNKEKEQAVRRANSRSADRKESKESRAGEQMKVQQSQPVYAQAEPSEGYPALYEYFNRELTYPKEGIADSVQGVVTVVFTVNTRGKPEKISIDQSLGYSFDKEVIRVIENMPLWKPATYNGKPIGSRISLPLTFQMKKIKTQ